jgi:hypothetical protein
MLHVANLVAAIVIGRLGELIAFIKKDWVAKIRYTAHGALLGLAGRLGKRVEL